MSLEIKMGDQNTLSVLLKEVFNYFFKKILTKNALQINPEE